jgi:hypothetical protein
VLARIGQAVALAAGKELPGAVQQRGAAPAVAAVRRSRTNEPRPLTAEWHAVQVIGTRCSTGFQSLSSDRRELNTKTTASASVRTLMLPNGFPPQVHEHEPACSQPSRCQRRTSIDLHDSHVSRPPYGHRDKWLTAVRSWPGGNADGRS